MDQAIITEMRLFLIFKVTEQNRVGLNHASGSPLPSSKGELDRV